MNYTLHQLRIFLKIVEKESVTKASEELYLTQPAVSIQLRNFQDQFPIPLTEVVGRKLFITDFGREIAGSARRILQEVEGINYKMQSFSGRLAGRLKLSVVSTGKYVMPYFLSDFVRANPAVDFVMDVTNKTKVVESLEHNAVDFALVSVIPHHLKLQKVPLMRNILYLVANPMYFKKIALSGKNADKEVPLIFREEGSATRMAMETYLKTVKGQVGKKMELTSNEAVKQAVLAGLGCSVMPVIGIKNALKYGELKIFPQKGLPKETTWNLVWLTSKKLSPAGLAFIDYLHQNKTSIIKENFSWLQDY